MLCVVVLLFPWRTSPKGGRLNGLGCWGSSLLGLLFGEGEFILEHERGCRN